MSSTRIHFELENLPRYLRKPPKEFAGSSPLYLFFFEVWVITVIWIYNTLDSYEKSAVTDSSTD